jgi:hypothetical protein
MALTRGNIVKAAKDRIYNSGLGEKPSIRQASGNSAVTGDIVTFTVADGTKVKAGHILSSWGSTDADDAYGFYVLSISSNDVTCVNGYDGAAIADVTAVPALLEHQAKVTEYQVQKAIDDILASYLFPEVFDIVMDSFTPDFTSLQANADPLDEDIIRGWQRIGGTEYQVPIKLIENVATGSFASGKMITYNVVSAIDVNYSAVRKVSIANSSDTALEGLIAKGAAALVIEGVEQPVSEEGEAQSRPLWQSFYNAKRQFETSIAKQSVTEFRVDRG